MTWDRTDPSGTSEVLGPLHIWFEHPDPVRSLEAAEALGKGWPDSAPHTPGTERHDKFKVNEGQGFCIRDERLTPVKAYLAKLYSLAGAAAEYVAES